MKQERYGESKEYEKRMFGTKGASLLSEVEVSILLNLLNVKKGEKLLELGCGSGRLSQRIVSEGGNVTGLDAQEVMIQQIKKKKLKNFKVIKQDLTKKFPFAENTFDKAYSVRVIKYIPGYEKVISEVSRVLKKDGTFVLEITNDKGWERLSKLFGHGTSKNIILFNKSEMVKVFAKYGFEVVESKATNKLPLTVWDYFGKLSLVLNKVLMVVTPETWLARGIMLKAKKVGKR
tara:strand:- start:34 stop:732 length:699 start_codon:yes stop_codon:yes gene_type:complete